MSKTATGLEEQRGHKDKARPKKERRRDPGGFLVMINKASSTRYERPKDWKGSAVEMTSGERRRRRLMKPRGREGKRKRRGNGLSILNDGSITRHGRPHDWKWSAVERDCGEQRRPLRSPQGGEEKKKKR